MIQLSIASGDVKELTQRLTECATEVCAVLYTSQFTRSDGLTRLLVRELDFPDDGDYLKASKTEAVLAPSYVAKVSKKARQEDAGIVFVHSHLGDEFPEFSLRDNEGEEKLDVLVSQRNKGRIHGAIVVSRGGIRARVLGSGEPISIIEIGERRKQLFIKGATGSEVHPIHDRQVRVFGPDAQAALQNLRVAIVGLGGTGSIVAQELAHLGVRDFILVDPDVVEESNLNRVANAAQRDIGRLKVDVASDYILRIVNNPIVATHREDIIRAKVASELANADIIFGCTDTHGSRAVIQQIAYQYFVPCIDIGTTIIVKAGRVSQIVGRIQLLAPGLACFFCGSLLDSSEVRRDMMTERERRDDPYLQGEREPAPAVMSINGTIASLGVTMLLAHVVGVPAAGRHLIYNAVNSTLRPVSVAQRERCYICSRSGAFARANSRKLDARHD